MFPSILGLAKDIKIVTEFIILPRCRIFASILDLPKDTELLSLNLSFTKMQNFYIVGYKVIVTEFVIYRDAEILHSSLG